MANRYDCSDNAVPQLTGQLAAEGIRSPRQERKTGRAYGGGAFSRGQLYAMLRNPIYAGDIPHKDKVYPGNHPPIIDRETWDAVQHLRASHVKGERRVRASAPSLLAGLLFDSAGEPLLAAHATKAGAAGTMRYRYYVSRALHHGTADSPASGVRLPAREIEQVVTQELAPLFDDPIALASRAALAISPGVLPQMSECCSRIASALRLRNSGCVREIVSRITVHDDRLDISLSAAATGELLGLSPVKGAPPQFGLTVEVRLTRTGRAIRLVQDGRALTGEAERDASLIRLVVKARQWWLVLAKGELTITALALQEGVTSSWLYRVVRLAFLAPEVVEGVLADTTVAGLDGAALLAPDAVPARWEQQRERFLAERTAG